MSFKQRRPRTTTARQRDTADDQDGDDLGSGISPMAAAQARRKREGKNKAATLSFADEVGPSRSGRVGDTLTQWQGDDEPSFVPRKSTLSQSVTLQKLAHQNTTQGPPPPPPSGLERKTTYNNDYLAQLKAATPTRATLAREPDVVVPYDDDDDDDDDLGIAVTPKGENPSAIPDEAAITSAITRRRRLAASSDPTSTQGGPGPGTDADYVSLNADTSRLAVYDSSHGGAPHPESRLQRESDSDGSGDDALAEFTGSKDRIRVGKPGNEEAARRMRREMRDAVEVVAEDEADEDEERWEVEQVRRAGAVVDDDDDAPTTRGIKTYTSAKSKSPKACAGWDERASSAPHACGDLAGRAVDIRAPVKPKRESMATTRGKHPSLEPRFER